MEWLPDEVLEHILSNVSPYEDGESCARVCSRWRSSMRKVALRRRSSFLSGLQCGSLSLTCIRESETSSWPISKRYSHSAAYLEKGLFVFGGCNSPWRAFNDLWRLELGSRTWTRLFTKGSYPNPKASASLLAYGKEELILYGGWSLLSLYPDLPASTSLLNELHIYSISNNEWRLISRELSDTQPPRSAGHSASIQGNNMILFGGLHKHEGQSLFASSNQLWAFNIPLKSWSRVLIPPSEPLPPPRYGHSQIKLSEEHFLILGGSDRGPEGGCHARDIWLFDMSVDPWAWRKCEVENASESPKDLWAHPACKVGKEVVVLSMKKNKKSLKKSPRRGGGVDREDPLLELRGQEPFIRPDPMGERMTAFATPQTLPPSLRRKTALAQKRESSQLPKSEDKGCFLHLLDVSQVISQGSVSWRKVNVPSVTLLEETLFYSLLPCRSELVMFGGLQLEAEEFKSSSTSLKDDSVSNNTHYFTLITEII